MELNWLIERCIQTSDKDDTKGKYVFLNGQQISDIFRAMQVPSWAQNMEQAYYYASPIRRLKALGVSGDLEELDKAIHERRILRQALCDLQQSTEIERG